MKMEKIKLDDFYLKTFFIGLGICGLVWSFMIFQFWWGNHDWAYLINGVSFDSGLYEARYSQHLPTVLFLDGHVLPVLTIICALAMMVVLGILIAVYLEIPKTLKNYLFLIFFMGLNPYNFVLFYYIYLSFVFIFWCVIGVCGLYLCEKPYKLYKILAGIVIFFLVLGSYPPNMALFLALFMIKRLIRYIENKENFKQIVGQGLAFAGVVIGGYACFRGMYNVLAHFNKINFGMYNIATKGAADLLRGIPYESLQTVLQLFHFNTFIELSYCLLTAFLVFLGCWAVFLEKKKKLVLLLLVVGVFLASRVSFFIGANATSYFVRLEYFARLGLSIFALAVLMRSQKKIVRNVLIFSMIWLFFVFVKADFEIQKIQYFGFKAARQYQQRLVERIVLKKEFEFKDKYIALTFGNPSFRNRYLEDKYKTLEMAEHSLFLHYDMVNLLFWESKVSPIVVGAGILEDGKSVLHINVGENKEKWLDLNYWKNNPENMQNLRYWLYTEANWNSFYVDDKYIIGVLSMPDFYKYREMVINNLDK